MNQQQLEKVFQSCACMHFRKASRIVTQKFDRSLSPLKLRSTQFSILVATRCNQPITMGKLAELLVVDQTAFSRNIRLLINSGLVQVERGKDRRSKLLTLTPLGEQKLERGMPMWEEAQREIEKIYKSEHWGDVLNELSLLEHLG